MKTCKDFLKLCDQYCSAKSNKKTTKNLAAATDTIFSYTALIVAMAFILVLAACWACLFMPINENKQNNLIQAPR